MSRKARATQLFESGVRALQEAGNDANSSNYETLLITAVNDLDRATELTADDLGNCERIYTQIRGSARAACLGRVQYDSAIDEFFSASPVMTALVGSGLRHMDNTPTALTSTVGEDAMRHFWSQLDQVVQQSILEARSELAAWKFAKGHWRSFERALLAASRDVSLEKFWCGCVAIVLYQWLSVDLPEKTTRCIAAMRRTLELGEPTPSFSSLGEHAPLFSRAVSTLRINTSAFPKRISYLESLAVYYAHQLQSSFVASMKLYESNPDQHHYLDSAIQTAELASEWTRDIPLLSKLRFELLLVRGLALRKNYPIHHRVDDLENAAICFREAFATKAAPTNELSSCRELLAAVLTDLVLSRSEPPDRNPEYFLKSLSIWREIVELTPRGSNALLAQRLLRLAKAAELAYSSDSGTLGHLVEASNCLSRVAEIEKDSTLLANVLFTRARILGERKDHPDFMERLSVGDAAFQLVKDNPQLLKDQTCHAGCTTHVDRLLGSVAEHAAHGDPQVNIQQLQEAIEALGLLISAAGGESTSSFLLSLATAYELLYRMQTLLEEPSEKLASTLYMALDAGETALKQMQAERRRYKAQSCHALVASVYDELSRLPGQHRLPQSKCLDLAIEHYRLATNRTGNYIKMTNALERRYLLHGQRQDLDECISRLILQNGGHNTAKQDFYMSAQLVRMCLAHNVRDKLLLAYKKVFQVLRRMSGLRHTAVVRYEALNNASAGYACDAAASALTNEDTTAAVELLEQGRGCFFSGQLPIQTDSDYVRSFDPDFAEIIEGKLVKIHEFSRATEENPSTHTILTGADIFNETGERMEFDETPSDVRLGLAVDDLEEALRKVRMLPGYQDETQPKSFTSLQLAAESCPISYLNISRLRCDALVLRGSDVLVVPLPTSRSIISNLSSTMQKVVRSQGRGFRDADSESTRHFIRSRSGPTPDQQIRGVLKQLWNMIVRPV
ncbi:hypothetical protein FRC08_002012, partial [Ceratobasidium sp. 394]